MSKKISNPLPPNLKKPEPPPAPPRRDDYPRRICLDKFSRGEQAIWEATRAVEEMGCDVRLTEAVILLCKARAKVADYIDGIV